jgi:thiol-disulfide isomerase/thioredoxin
MIAIAVLAARAALSMVFGVAGIAKLRDRKQFRMAVAGFGVPGRLVGPVASVLPPAEIAIAVLLLTPLAVPAAVAAFALLAAFTAAIGVNLARGRAPECRCFGQVKSAPIGAATLARNVALAGLAAAIAGRGAQPGAPIVVAMLVLIVTALVIATSRNLITGSGLKVVQPVPAVDPLRLPIGAIAPAFHLQRAGGGTLSLDQLRADGLPVMLIFSAPGCGACAEFLPVARIWEQAFETRMRIVVVSKPSADGSHTQGASTVLFEKEHEIADLYGVPATPAALLVNADGTIGSTVKLGSNAISTLLPGLPPRIGTTRRDAIKYTVAAASAGSLMAACAAVTDPCSTDCRGDNGSCYSCTGSSFCSRSGGSNCSSSTSGVACCSSGGGGGGGGSCNCQPGNVYNYLTGKCCPNSAPYYYPGTHGGGVGCYASCPYIGDCGTTYQHC